MFLRRFLSFILDLVSIVILLQVLFIPVWIIEFILIRYFDLVISDIFHVLIIALFLLNKDYPGGRSIGKRLMGLKIVDSKSGIKPSKLKCFIRNLSIVIYPIEGIVLLFNSSKRIGDYFVGTEIIECEKSNISSYFYDLLKDLKK